MLEIAEEIKQRFRGDNNCEETVRTLELSFFNRNVDTLYPSNDLYPSGDLFPADAGSPWLTIGMDRICAETLSLTESLSSGDNIVWGSCESAKLTLTVADVEDDIKGKEFTATLSIGDYSMAYGIYTVDSVIRQADRRKRKITAYDRMKKFDTDVSGWYQAMYPEESSVHTLKELRDSLCDYIGVSQKFVQLPNDDLVIGKTIVPKTLCGRDVLRAICEINGVFGHFDRTGALAYISLQNTGVYPSETLYPGNDLFPQSGWQSAEDLEYYKTITYEDYLIDGIDRVQIRQEEGDIGAVVGSGSNAYVVEGNFLTYGMGSADLTKLAWSVYDLIAGKTYRPAKIVSYAMPWIEAGDGIRAITTDTEIATFVLHRTMSGIQAMMDTMQAKGTKQQGQSFGISNEIIQLKGKTAVIVRSVEEVSVKLSDVEKNTTAQVKVVSDAIEAEVKRATGQEVELAASIKVMAGQIEQKVSAGDLVAKINLEANKAGSKIVMEAGHFVLKGTNFWVNEDGSGGAANGNLTWNAAGKLVAVGMELRGTANTSSIGANVINCNHLEVGGISAGGDISTSSDMVCDTLYAGYVYADNLGTSSDRRLKKRIRSITENDAWRIVGGLRPVSYRLRNNNSPGIGFIAQEVKRLEKGLVLTGKRGKYWAIYYQNFIPLLVAVVQKQQRELEQMKEDLYGRK